MNKFKDWLGWLRYTWRGLGFIKSLWSPFKPFRLRFYFGPIRMGVPIFLPRKWVRTEKGHTAKSLKWFGINYCFLGYKTKWHRTDYRFEWPPIFSLVLLKRQFCITVEVPEPEHYWTAWLYYDRDTDKSKSKPERIQQCIKGFPMLWTQYRNGNQIQINYYYEVLRDKYKKYI